MKNLFLLLMPVLLFNTGAFTQTVMKLDYNKEIKLGTKIAPDNVYELAKSWISENGSFFTSVNAEPPATNKTKNKLSVEEAYDNKHPLQSLDPSRNRVLGEGLIKYFGGSTTSIRLMYVKYDINIEAKAGKVLFSISNVRYYHFNQKTYAELPVHSFKGGMPCDYTGKMDYLLNCQLRKDEVDLLAQYFNKTVMATAEAFTTELRNKKMLYVAPTAVPKKAASSKPKPKLQVVNAAVGKK